MSKARYTDATKLVILDWDGVAYPYSLTFLNDSLHAIISHVVEEKHPGISPEAAKEKANKLFNRTLLYTANPAHKLEFSGFFKKHYGLEEEEVLSEIRKRTKDLHFLKPSPEIRQEIECAQKRGVKLVILSQSSTDWLHAGVAKLGLSELLDDSALFGIDKTRRNKHDGTDAYQYVLEQTGFTPEETLTVDDSRKNLVQAHKLGIATAYIPKIWRLHALHSPNPEGTRHAHPNLLDFLKAFNSDYGRLPGKKETLPTWSDLERKRRRKAENKEIAR